MTNRACGPAYCLGRQPCWMRSCVREQEVSEEVGVAGGGGGGKAEVGWVSSDNGVSRASSFFLNSFSRLTWQDLSDLSEMKYI